MAARALDFAQAHPATDPGYTALVAQLQDAVTRGDSLAVLQRDGRLSERAAQALREALRRAMARIQVRHLVGVAQRAAKGHPELKGLFVQPKSGGPNRMFTTAVRSMIAAAQPNQALLVAQGLGPTLLDDLTASLDQFEKATDTAHAGRRDHVGAAAELEVVAGECAELVELLDGVYRIRFQNDAQSLASWESSRNLVGPFRPAQDATEPPPAPEPQPEPGTEPPAPPVGPGENPLSKDRKGVA